MSNITHDQQPLKLVEPNPRQRLDGRNWLKLNRAQDLLEAIGAAMHTEYKQIVDNGLLVQLDAEARRAMQEMLSAHHAEHRMTAIIVSHDVPEIVRVADTVLTLASGAVARRETAAAFGEDDEATRCAVFLRDSSATGAAALGI